jgi:hypothetical protein
VSRFFYNQLHFVMHWVKYCHLWGLHLQESPMNQGVAREAMTPAQIRGLLIAHGIAYVEQMFYRTTAAGAEVACRVGVCIWKHHTEPIRDLVTAEGLSELNALIAAARQHVVDQHGQ